VPPCKETVQWFVKQEPILLTKNELIVDVELPTDNNEGANDQNGIAETVEMALPQGKMDFFTSLRHAVLLGRLDSISTYNY
jgi:hypothetical protein